MSHFTVLIRASNKLVEEYGGIEEAAAKILAPYQENNMGDCPQEYLQFYPAEKEYEDEYKPCGPNGERGYWENPNARWDWWQLGGRWQGSFRLKECAESGIKGSPGVMCDPIKDPYLTDAAQKKDIDFEGMDLEVQGKIDKWWMKYLEFKKNNEKEEGIDMIYGIHHDLIEMGLRETPPVNHEEICKARNKFPEDRDKWPESVWNTKEFTRFERESPRSLVVGVCQT